MRKGSLALLLFSSACAREVVPVTLAPPSDARSLIVGIDRGGVLQMSGASLDPFSRPDLLPFVAELEGEAQLYALYYRASLAELEIAEGVLEPTDDPERALPLPDRFLRAQMAHVRDGSAAPWSDLSSLDGRLREFRFRASGQVCTDFEARTFNLGAMLGAIGAIAAIDDERVLVAPVTSPEMYEVSAGGFTARPRVDRFFAHSAFRDGRGEIWLGGGGGKLYHGTVTSTFTAAPRSPTGSILRWMDGARGDAPFELFTMAISGSFERFDGAAWETFVHTSTIPVPTSRAAVVWLGPGRAIAVPPQDNGQVDISYYVYDASAEPKVEHEVLNSGLVGEPASGTWIEGLGAVFVTNKTKVLVYRGDRIFDQLGDPSPLSDPNAIVPYRSGFLIVGGGIAFSEWHPAAGFCPPQATIASFKPLVAVRFGRNVLIAGIPRREEETPVVVLVPR